MNVLRGLMAVLLVCGAARADNGIVVPWDEFKSLFRQHIEQELNTKAAAPAKTAQVQVIDDAQYSLCAGAGPVQGEVTLSGKILAGGPEPIPLFDSQLVVAETRELAGGTLLSAQEGAGLAFLPDATVKEFRLTLSFLLEAHSENGTHTLEFAIPGAVRNSVKLTLPDEAHLAEMPGIPDANGVYHLSAQPRLRIKYLNKKPVAVPPPPAIVEVDSVTLLHIDKNRLIVSASFQPMRAAPEVLVLHAPSGAQFLASTLGASRIAKAGDDQYEVRLAAGDTAPFSVEWALEGWVGGGEAPVTLPVLEGNTGAEDRFAVEEPDDGEVTVAAEGLVPRIPAEKLGEILSAKIGKSPYFMKVPPRAAIRLAYQPFQTVSAPAIVLDSQSLYVSFEENGTVLSMLTMEVPAEAGARMKLKAIPGAEIWSLTVNGVKQTVYAGEQGVWIIPLENAKANQVALAFLTHGPKLALQGALEAAMPETGFSSRELRVGLALPGRVNLLSVDGPVSPTSGADWPLPPEFSGKHHFFTQAFYNGEGMKVSLAYKEPVNPAQLSKDAKP